MTQEESEVFVRKILKPIQCKHAGETACIEGHGIFFSPWGKIITIEECAEIARQPLPCLKRIGKVSGQPIRQEHVIISLARMACKKYAPYFTTIG